MSAEKKYFITDPRIMSGAETNLFTNAASLYLDKKISDVTFLVQGRRIPAHKAILAANSEHFQKSFEAIPEKKEYEISFSSQEAFKHFLEYIYRGTTSIPPTIELFASVFFLATQFSFDDLAAQLVVEIEEFLDEHNVVYLINEAYEQNCWELVDLCNTYIDDKICFVLWSETFEDLTEKALTEILKRESFAAVPQIEIFKSVAKWCKKSKKNVISECVSMSLFTLSEIMSIVWPTNLVDCEKLLDIIAGIVGDRFAHTRRTIEKIPDKNFATVENGATAMVVSEEAKRNLFNNETCVDFYTEHNIVRGEKNCIIIRLKKPYFINHIRMRLYDDDGSSCLYYIETSVDEAKWHRIVDYSGHSCRSVQNVYFAGEVVQYIKLVGISNCLGETFRVVFFEAFYKTEIPDTVNGVICSAPMTCEEKTIILNDTQDKYKDKQVFVSKLNYKFHGFLIQLSQPYRLTNFRLVLDNKYHEYTIDTSTDKVNWKPLFNSRIEGRTPAREVIEFPARDIVFIRIKGFCAIEGASLTLLVHGA